MTVHRDKKLSVHWGVWLVSEHYAPSQYVIMLNLVTVGQTVCRMGHKFGSTEALLPCDGEYA